MSAMADLQYAIARGLEVVFQLEEGEVLGEALPERSDRRSILIYEAAEGGAGVLSQLVANPDALARVMAKAIETCHFDVERFEADGELHDVADAQCVAGCYRCLLSYYNQTDHRSSNAGTTASSASWRGWRGPASCASEAGEPAPADETDPAAEPQDPLLAAIVARGLEPLTASRSRSAAQAYPYVWRAARVAAAPKACRSRYCASSPTRG